MLLLGRIARRFAPSRALLLLAGAMLAGILLPSTASAQAVSQINGTAKDQTGAIVPGVEVTATQTETGLKRTSTTDENGSFILPNLPLGPYTVQATKQGFRTYSQAGIQLQVGSAPAIPITMQVGDVTQTVEVAANAALVETEKTGVGTVMETQRILDLPLNGRNPTDLIALTPGAVQTGSSPVWNMNTGVQIVVAGGQSYGVYYSLDGAPNLNLYDATNLPLPFPDALQEFKVETNAQQAQAGMHAGAQVSSVTKGGTNSFHGDAFEFFRNGDLNARNFFSPAQDTLKRNQFGGTVGGPIRRNKIFFFAGYQGTTLRQTPSPTTAFVPTAQMLRGDFSTFASAACQGKNVTLNAPFTTIGGVPNQLPQAAISSVALKIAGYLPPPTNACGQVQYSILVSQYFWQIPARVDYQLSDKQSIFVRYMATKQNQVLPYSLTPNNILTAASNGLDDLAQSALVGHTWIVSPTAVNSLRLSVNRIDEIHLGARYFGPTDVGINAFSYISKALALPVTGAFTIGYGPNEDLANHDTYLQANDDFNLIRGSHQFSFGGNMIHSLISYHASVNAIGSYAINGQTTGLGMGDFMAGLVSKVSGGLPNPLYLHQWFLGAYAQDTWKATKRLTLNYGLRWEPSLPQQLNDESTYTFSMARYNANVHSTVWTNAPAGLYYPGDPGYNGKAGINNRWSNFEPRIGLAWDPFGDGKTVIRAGASLAYEFWNEQMYLNSDLAAPFTDQTYVLGPVPIANPWGSLPGGNPFPFTPSKPLGNFLPGSSFIPLIPDLKSPRTYSWNTTVQRQFTPALFASASYVGSHSLHLLDNIELNPGVFIPGNCAAGQYGLTKAGPCSNTANVNNRRVLFLQDPVKSLNIANLTQYDDGATSSYHGLILSSQWRATSSVNLNANYTWSHCISDPSTGNSTNSVGSNYVHLGNRTLDRGNCIGDRRHIFNFTAVGRTPNFASKPIRLVASGWSVSGIYRFTSGTPMSILSGLDNALAGFTNERPNQVLANTASPTQGSACANIAPCVSWLNPAAFAQPVNGTLGSIGAYNVLGPKFFQFDMALVREFAIRENARIQFRAEAFNVFNNVRFNAPNTPTTTPVNLNAPQTFGDLLNAYDPRIIQLAMKFTF